MATNDLTRAFGSLLRDLVGQQATSSSPVDMQAQRPAANVPISPKASAILSEILAKGKASRAAATTPNVSALPPTQPQSSLGVPSRADVLYQQQYPNENVIPAIQPPGMMPADIAAGHNLPTTDPLAIAQMYQDTRNLQGDPSAPAVPPHINPVTPEILMQSALEATPVDEYGMPVYDWHLLPSKYSDSIKGY